MQGSLLIIFPDFNEGDWTLQDDGNGPYIKAWNRSEPEPTDAEIEAARPAAEAARAATQYRRDRVYPPIGDQLDDLFRQGAFSPEMAATLHAVKTAHPKGTS